MVPYLKFLTETWNLIKVYLIKYVIYGTFMQAPLRISVKPYGQTHGYDLRIMYSFYYLARKKNKIPYMRDSVFKQQIHVL